MVKSEEKFTVVIVLNWNDYPTTKNCLISLEKVKYKNFEVVIVDNGSEDDSVQQIRKNFPKINLIEAGENLGYAGGNNLGINYALRKKADYIVILNNDIVVTANFIKEMVKVAEKNKNIGVVSPKMYYPETKRFYSAGGYIDWKNGTGHHRGHLQEDKGQFDDNINLDFAPGAAFLVKKEVFEKVGKLPEDFFLMADDLDWCTRVRKGGFDIIFAPKSVVYHFESVSYKVYHKGLENFGMWSPTKYYFFARSLPRFIRKHRRGKDWFIFLFYHYVLLSKILIKELKYRNFRNFFAIVQGHLDFWLGKKGKWK